MGSEPALARAARPRIRVERLALGEVTFPEWHPRASESGCAVFGYAIVHPDGVIVFDTGVGVGNAIIDRLYAPVVVSITDALASIEIDERDVVAIVNSHLHFDHCGQNATLLRHGASVFVHEAECAALDTIGHYTVPEWAHVPEPQLRRVRGDEQIVEGVTIVPTPGHTPGHQSLVIDSVEGRTVVAGQCVYSLGEVRRGRVALDNMHDPSYESAGQDSLRRLLGFRPCSVVAAHDSTPCSLF